MGQQVHRLGRITSAAVPPHVQTNWDTLDPPAPAQYHWYKDSNEISNISDNLR